MYVDRYIEELLRMAENISNEHIRNTVLSILKSPLLSFTPVKPVIQFDESPAAPRKHHMFAGGLLVHTYSVTKIALAICDVLEEAYDIKINRDLVIAAAILHDIFKYYQYTRDDREGGYKPRDDWYLSHDYAIIAELAVRGVGDNLIRVVSEVHGVAPIKTYEGLVVHLADTIDAKFGEYIQNDAVAVLREFEQLGCKPYAVLNNVVKNFGARVLGILTKNRGEFLELAKKICSSSNTQ